MSESEHKDQCLLTYCTGLSITKLYFPGAVCRHLNAGTRVQIEGFNKGKGQSVSDFKECSDLKGQHQV